MILENLYDRVLEVEQLRRDQPPQEEEEAYETWSVCTILLLHFSPEDEQGEVLRRSCGAVMGWIKSYSSN